MNRLISLAALVICLASCRKVVHTDYGSFGARMQQSFIWHDQEDTLSIKAHSTGFRKVLSLQRKPSEASMMIFADSRYVLWINGEYVERGPCRFDPKGPQYDVLDISRFLVKGSNTLAVLVQGSVTGSLKIMKHRPGLSAIVSVDGSEYATDSTWLCSEKVPEQMLTDIWTWSCVLDSVNATVDDYGWQKPGFSERGWTRAQKIKGESWGKLSKRYIPLLKETCLGSGTLRMIRNGISADSTERKLTENLPLKLVSGDEVVIDAGQLSLSYWTLMMHAMKGTELVFTPCQDFVKGETIINYNCITKYLAREGAQTYMPAETFGFRYLNVRVSNGSVTIDSIKFTGRLYPNTELASFECDDDFLNRTWKQSSYTSEVLCEDGYVDSAERAEWMADVAMIQYPVSRMVISGPGDGDKTICSDPRLLHNMLLHTAQSQMPDGRLKAHHPSDRFDLHWYIEDYSCLWVQALKQYYENTADTAFLNEMWPVLKLQIKWFLDRKNRSGLITAREFLIHLDNPMRYQVCQGATVNAFIYKALKDASSIAGYLGRDEDAGIYQREADTLKRAYNALLFDEATGGYNAAVYYPELKQGERLPDLRLVQILDPASQTKTWSDGNVQWIKKGDKVPATIQAVLSALSRGIVSDDHLERARAYLAEYCAELKNPYTHLMLFDELYSLDQDSADIKVLNIIRTRWKSMVSRVSPGTAAEGFETQGYLCHPFGLIPAYILPSYVLGVRKPAPVWDRTILIEPHPGDLHHAKGAGLTEFGPVPVEWDYERTVFRFTFTVPDNTEAFVRLPLHDKASKLYLNGEETTYTPDGRFATFWVKSGTYKGSLGEG